jgi:hypothetical protein
MKFIWELWYITLIRAVKINANICGGLSTIDIKFYQCIHDN